MQSILRIPWEPRPFSTYVIADPEFHTKMARVGVPVCLSQTVALFQLGQPFKLTSYKSETGTWCPSFLVLAIATAVAA